ncbi:MAG: tetratricopeptide repeat protein [Polyangiales bacterium]
MYVEARALLILGLLDDDCTRLDSALSRIERSVDLLRACGDRWNEEVALNATGLLHKELGRPVEARAYFDEALSICDELGFRSGAACVLGNLAWLELATGDLDRAIERCHQSVALARAVGHRFFEASGLATLAAIEARRDRLAAARAAFEQAEACAQEFPSPSLRASIDVSRGSLELAEGRAARARGDEAAALGFERAARARLERANTLSRELCDGDVRTAMRALRAELGPIDEQKRAPSWLRVWGECAAFQVEGGEPVDLARFGVHRRVLVELVRAHEEGSGARRSVTELFARVWPDERVGLRSMRNRVHVALCALRKAGLASALESHADGYRLARGVRLEREATPSPTGD